MVVGIVLAITAAWRRRLGRRRRSRRVLDILFAFPGILLAVLAAAVFGPSLTAAALALAIAYTPYIARVLRGAALRERAREYIAACEVQGLSAIAICARHLVPNIIAADRRPGARSCSATRWSTSPRSRSSASACSRRRPTGA